MMDAAMPMKESVPYSLKMSKRSPLAAEAEIVLTMARGSSSSGKFSIPTWLMRLPMPPHRKSSRPEERRTLVPTRRPIRVGSNSITVLMPSAAPWVKSSKTLRFMDKPWVIIYAAVKGIMISDKYRRNFIGFRDKSLFVNDMLILGRIFKKSLICYETSENNKQKTCLF